MIVEVQFIAPVVSGRTGAMNCTSTIIPKDKEPEISPKNEDNLYRYAL